MRLLGAVFCLAGLFLNPYQFARGQSSLPIGDVDRQPLEASVERLVQAVEKAGSPLPESLLKRLKELKQDTRDASVAGELQTLLDPLCLAAIQINPESRVKVVRGDAPAELQEKGWTNFLVKVVNEAGVTAPLSCSSPQAEPMFRRGSNSPNPKLDITPADANGRWLDIGQVTSQPMTKTLSGLGVEYRIVQLYSRDAGSREATLAFDVGQGTQDLGFRSEVPILFHCRPSVEIPLVIRDESGRPTTCSLLIRDAKGRIHPNPSRRLAPDFFFHNQVYRQDGESIRLAEGKYQVIANRGPEYLPSKFDIEVQADAVTPVEVRLKRWIHMAGHGWFSGDHHVHAAGCSHYDNPTQGVTPKDMLRHVIGEDLNVGCVLSWGPCWYYQKEFFDGRVSKLSLPGNLMRYDVEVSGFPSSHAGHLCLLNLTEDDYPGTETIEEWPSWTLPILAWGKEQGGVVGYSHSGWGLALPDYLPGGGRAAPANYGQRRPPAGRAADKLPDYAMPPFDGIGANEFIVAAVAGRCDFISAVDTPAIWELNIWYHTLNCGATTRISGETDFPCIYGERVGLGRSYVQIPGVEPADLSYQAWVDGLRDGRSYVGDGMSHLLKFEVAGFSLGDQDPNFENASTIAIEAGSQKVKCTVAALLPAEQSESGKQIAQRRLDAKPYWHLERARDGASRRVPVELIVNGQVAATRLIEANGKPQDILFEVELPHSSWVAVRILPSMHSNPIFCIVNDKPIRASRRSAQWCLDAVDVCWGQKKRLIKEAELGAAAAAYQMAREKYQRRLVDSVAE